MHAQAVEGVPFVMSLVIGQMGVVAGMLIFTGVLLSMQHSAAKKGDDFRKAKRGQFFKRWQAAFEFKKLLDAKVGMPPPPPTATKERHHRLLITQLRQWGCAWGCRTKK